MFSHGYYSVISPEGAAAIEGHLRGGARASADLVERCAKDLHLTAEDNLKFGYIDKIIQEPVLRRASVPLRVLPHHPSGSDPRHRRSRARRPRSRAAARRHAAPLPRQGTQSRRILRALGSFPQGASASRGNASEQVHQGLAPRVSEPAFRHGTPRRRMVRTVVGNLQSPYL